METPRRMFGKPPREVGPLAGITLDEDGLNEDYLIAMDWDLETAKPSKKKLIELDMEDVAKVLWP
jgi:hypothetical protein